MASKYLQESLEDLKKSDKKKEINIDKTTKNDSFFSGFMTWVRKH